jgi:ribosomal protein L30E
VGIDQKLQENIEQLGTDEQVNHNSEQIIIADNTPQTLRTKVLHVADLKNDGNNPITAHTSKQTSLLNTIINRQDIQNDASESVSALVVGFLKK